MAHYIDGCLFKTLASRTAGADDFSLINVTATEDSGTPGDFDVQVSLDVNQMGDVASIVSGGNVTFFDDLNAETPVATDAGPNVTGIPGKLTVTGTGITQTSSNVGNTWKVVFANVQVVGKDGQTFTIASISKTFLSPL